LPWFLKSAVALIVVATVAAVVHGFVSGAWFGCLLQAAFVAGFLDQWTKIRRESDNAKELADRMIIGVMTLLIWFSMPALRAVEALLFG
jgi:hypothetical protein